MASSVALATVGEVADDDRAIDPRLAKVEEVVLLWMLIGGCLCWPETGFQWSVERRTAQPRTTSSVRIMS